MESIEISKIVDEGIHQSTSSFHSSTADQGKNPSVKSDLASPLVVIEYRQHGLVHRLMPAALVLLAAIAISSFQRRTPVRLIPNRPRVLAASLAPSIPTAEAAPTANTNVAETPPQDKPEPIDPIIPPPSTPVPVVKVAMNDRSTTKYSLFELGESDGLTPLEALTGSKGTFQHDDAFEISDTADADSEKLKPQTVEIEPFAPKTEGPNAQDILNDIQREASEKEAEQQRVAALKPQAKALMEAEVAERTLSDRASFHKELKSMIGKEDPEIYEHIDALCNRFGRTLSQDLKAKFIRAQKSLPARQTRKDQILALRNLELPEPTILDYLVNKAMMTVKTRSGPADNRQAVILAAKQLLAIPPGAPARKSVTTTATKVVTTQAPQ